MRARCCRTIISMTLVYCTRALRRLNVTCLITNRRETEANFGIYNLYRARIIKMRVIRRAFRLFLYRRRGHVLLRASLRFRGSAHHTVSRLNPWIAFTAVRSFFPLLRTRWGRWGGLIVCTTDGCPILDRPMGGIHARR